MLRIVASSSSKLIPIAFRARNAFANPLPLLSGGRRFSSKTYEYAMSHSKLVKALDSEIKHTQIISLRPEAPVDFPFKIQHTIGGNVTLTRELDGEEIEVRLLKVDGGGNQDHADDGAATTDSSDSESDSDSSDSDEESPAKSVDLKIEISKPNGKSMKFGANASADEIVIERLTTRDGDNNVICSQLHIAPESELQTAFREFLENRGIKKSIAAFLCDYAMWNSKIRYAGSARSLEAYSAQKQNVEILEKLKNVIANW